MTTEEIRQQLRKKYEGDAYAFFEEVPDGTGSNKYRSADAMAMSLWPSRGLDLIGFEVKVSRADWLKELKTPAKAESIARYCDYWYLVAPKDLIPDHEIPTNWGLLESTGKKFRTIKKAVKLNPEPIDRKFLAGLLRKASEEPERHRLQGYTAGLKISQDRGDGVVEQLEGHILKLKETISQFKEASGVDIDRMWITPTKIGSAVRLVLEKPVYTRDMIKHVAVQLKDLVAHMDRVDEELGKL